MVSNRWTTRRESGSTSHWASCPEPAHTHERAHGQTNESAVERSADQGNHLRFQGQDALVTGGASGIGEACVLTFARGGANVVIADLNADLGERVVAAAQQAGGDARFVPADVSLPTSVASMVDAAMQAFGRLDIAVNNAGIGGESKPIGDYGLDSWHKVIDVNLNAVFY